MRWWLLLPIAIGLSMFQAFLTVHAEHARGPRVGYFPTSTMISVIAFGLLVLLVLAFNPLMRLVRVIKPFSRQELMSIFVALTVTAGISTFGLADQLLPLLPAPYNPAWNLKQAGWDEAVHPYINKSLYLQGETAEQQQQINDFYQGLGEEPPESDGSWAKWRYFFGTSFKVPWSIWLKPLALWSIFIAACYGMFYSLTYIVLDYWSNREKLLFPLAKLPESLLPESNDSRRWIPPIFSSGLFWIGAGFSLLLLSYNAGIQSSVLPPSLGQLQLGMSWRTFSEIVKGTYLSGYSGANGMMFLVIFTAIGIAFLLPLEISFSIWFYFLVGRTIIFIATRLGYGQNYASFGDDWMWQQNVVSAQGAGGLLFFSALSLARCAKEYITLAVRAKRSLGERLKIAMPVVGLVISMAVMWIWLGAQVSKFGMVGWAVAGAMTIFLTLMTLGLMRIVAEGGIYWFQSHASFFHLFKMVGAGNVVPPAIVAPLLPIYTVLFLDIKTFMAPNLVNGAKMHQDVGGNRIIYHLTVVLSIVASLVTAIFWSLTLAYARGAQRMQGWFYTNAPKLTIDDAAKATSMNPQFQLTTFVWFVIGVLWVAASMYIRRYLFWFPHPVGYIMLVNPLGSMLWFSFFLGWAFKKLVVKYGGKTTFDKARQIFIGLIIGELLAIFIYGIVAMTGTAIKIDLNRYGP